VALATVCRPNSASTEKVGLAKVTARPKDEVEVEVAATVAAPKVLVDVNVQKFVVLAQFLHPRQGGL